MNWLEVTLWVVFLWGLSSIVLAVLWGWWVSRGRRPPPQR